MERDRIQSKFDSSRYSRGDWMQSIQPTPENDRYTIEKFRDSKVGETGDTETQKIVFDDPSVLEEAVKKLKSGSKVSLEAEGEVQRCWKKWDYSSEDGRDVLIESKQTTEKGIISCDLELEDGCLKPFTYTVSPRKDNL